jgi:bifunctional UDP-N-acetylglucosamine pyrophosphorylase/glucosamine-1-phosphate N-acetyltransferase
VISGPVTIGANCRVGPFAHLRSGAELAENVEVGAFVEISRSKLDGGTIARHLAYVGDAVVGRNVNIGCGAVTANFDGTRKSETLIGDNALIGAGAVMIAPVEIGRNTLVGAGAVVTRGNNVADGATVVGVPARPLKPEKG